MTAPSDPVATPSRTPLALALGGLVALAVAMGVGRFAYTPILPHMIAGLGLTPAASGLIGSANFAGYLLGAIAAASPRLRGSRRLWMLSALAASVATTTAMGLVASVPAFAALRFVGGVASAFVMVFSATLILERLQLGRRPDLVGVQFVGVGVGIAISALLVAGLVAVGADWRAHWLVVGGVSLVALYAVAVLVPEATEPRSHARPDTAPMDRRLQALILAYGLCGFGYVVTATFLLVIVRETDAIGATEPVAWLIVGVAAALSVPSWSRVEKRIGVMPAYALAALIEAIGVAASVLWPTPLGLVVAAVALGGTFVGMTSLGLVAARDLARGDPRHALASMTAAWGLGQIIGPIFTGYSRDLSGSFALPSLVAAACLLLAAAIAWHARR
jgi:predicted MFS family arabinose efflux permease